MPLVTVSRPISPVLVVVPAQPLFGHVRSFRIRAEIGGITIAVSLADSVATGGQCDGLLIVHGHAREGLAHVLGGAAADRDCRPRLPD